MFSYRALALVAVAGSAFAQTTVYEAEKAVLNGVTVGTSVTGFTGQLPLLNLLAKSH